MKYTPLCLLLAVILAAVSIIPAGSGLAQDSINLENNIKIQDLLSEHDVIGDFGSVQYLKDYNDRDRYVYLPLEKEGYLIYDYKLDIIIEYSFENNTLIKGLSNLYYTAPLGYYQRQGDEIVDLRNKSTIGSLTEFKENATNIDAQIQQKLNRASGRANTLVLRASDTVPGTVPKFTHNPDGICGTTSAAMMLMWYDTNVNGNYVATSHESSSGTGSVFINYLRSYIDGPNPGSYTGDVSSGINSYCSTRGITHNSSYDWVYDYLVVGRISTFQRPFVIGVVGHSTFGNHWLTAYGYYTSGSNTYVNCNTGWSNPSTTSLNVNVCSTMVW